MQTGARSARKKSLTDIVEEIGFGPTHLRYIVTGGAVNFADGSELLLISAINKSLTSEWHLTPFSRGSLVTIVYFGVLAGNLSSGPIGDKYGRRICMLISYAVVFVACYVSSYSNGYAELAIFRFVCGYGFGMGVPAYNALVSEVTPRAWRMLFMCTSFLFFSSGELYGAVLILLDDPSMEDLDWRDLMRKAAIPAAVFFVIAWIWLLESPHYLALIGEDKLSKETLRSNARDNGLTDIDVEFKAVPKHEREEEKSCTFGSEFLILCNPSLGSTTFACVYTALSFNFTYYGVLYAFPLLLPELAGKSGSAGLQLMIGALWEIPGALVAALLGSYFYRKPALRLTVLCMAIFAFLFVMGTTLVQGTAGDATFHFGYYGLKGGTAAYGGLMYLLTSEVYPTSLRTTGCAVAAGFGRVGCMVAPLFYEFLHTLTGSHALFFFIIAFACILNAFIISLIPIEPATANLANTVDDVEDPSSDVHSTKRS